MKTNLISWTYEILLNGQAVETPFLLSVLSVRVEEELNLPSMFTLRMKLLHHSSLGQFEGEHIQDVNERLFNQLLPGTSVEIRMGEGTPETVFQGSITSLEPDFQTNPSLEVRGYDSLYELRFGRKIQSFTEIQDSRLVTQIVQAAGLTVQADETSTVYPYVLQNNVSDYEFLLSRAERLGYEVFVRNDTLHFRKPAEREAPVQTLSFSKELESFSAVMRTITEGSEIEYRGWNPDTKESFSGKAKIGDETKQPSSGAKAGSTYAKDGFKEATSTVVTEPSVDATHAETLAKAHYNRYAGNFITADCVALGNPAIRIGSTVELDFLGEKFSGVYYVTAATHIYDAEGYSTRFQVRRSSI